MWALHRLALAMGYLPVLVYKTRLGKSSTSQEIASFPHSSWSHLPQQHAAAETHGCRSRSIAGNSLLELNILASIPLSHQIHMQFLVSEWELYSLPAWRWVRNRGT